MIVVGALFGLALGFGLAAIFTPCWVGIHNKGPFGSNPAHRLPGAKTECSRCLLQFTEDGRLAFRVVQEARRKSVPNPSEAE
jgi:hypothetical protein